MVAKADSVIYIEGHRKWYLAGLILSLILFVVSTYMAIHKPLTGWEYRWLIVVNSWPGSWHKFITAIAFIGGSTWTAVASVVITFIAKMYRLSWRIAAEVLLLSGIVFATRHFVNRASPNIHIHSLHVRAALNGSSFPSAAVGIATVISLSILPYLPMPRRFIVPAWIALIGLAELYLGVHAPLDLLGGLAVGIFTVSLVRIIPQPFKVLLRLD